MSTDLNLLFGVLALQADLLDAARFAEACSAWAARKDRPLSALLTERGWLNAEDVAHVEYLLERKLQKHHGDARAGLAAVTTDEVRHSLASVVDDEIQHSLAGITPSVPWDEGSTTAHEPEGRGRYRLTRLHAQGGIGQVWLAHDHELRRDVALKELRPERRGHPVVQARFLEEARITGQLEHPSIVPVHELVESEGQTFYTMRMVQGRTLAEAIRDYHRKRQQRQPVRLELRALLNHLVAVCNAVGYAHSRGVLHRDLKPQNVVLGDYGEVMVLDWGLAKLLGQTADEPGSLLPVTLEPGSRDETVQGQVLGTPGYMAPEQAEGRLDLLGPATDVYGLGAILYHTLTGQAPFSGANDEVLPRIAREEPTRPRQLVPGVPRPLEAVCLKALAKKPADRYASAGELAKEIEQWLADEPVNAWREPWRVKAGRWVRRHQSLVASLTVGVVTVLLLGGMVVSWVMRDRGLQRASAESALAHVANLQREARWEEARATLDQAEARLGGSGPAELRRLLAQVRADLELAALLDSIRQQRNNPFEWEIDRTDDVYATAFADAGLGNVGDNAAETAQRVLDSPVREALVAALDDWAGLTRSKDRRAWLMDVARQVDPHPWRNRLRDPTLWENENDLARLVAQVPASALTHHLATPLGFRLGHRAEGEAMLRAAQQKHPGDFWLNDALGNSLRLKAQFPEAVSYYRAALALRPDSSGANHVLGWVLARMGQLTEAEICCRRAVSLAPTDPNRWRGLVWVLALQNKRDDAVTDCRKAIALNPKNVAAHSALGWALLHQGKPAAAEACWREACTLEPNTTDAYLYLGLGHALKSQRKLPEAAIWYRKAIDLHPRFAEAYANLGWVLQVQGKLAEAEPLIRKALDLDAKNAVIHTDLGIVLERQGKLAEAEVYLRKAIELDAKLADAHDNLGWVLQRQPDKWAEAEACYRKAIAINPNHPLAHNNLLNLLEREGKLADAERFYRQGIALDPTNALVHRHLADVLQRQGKPGEGLAMARKAHQLDPNNTWIQQNLPLLQRLAALEAKLPAFLNGDFQPRNNEERLALASLCLPKQLNRAAAGLYAEVFAADAKLAQDINAGHRYNAACCAALAGCGKGNDAATLDEKEKTRLRAQALAWLQANLGLWSKRPDSDKSKVRNTMLHWQQDKDFAGVRDKEALAALPDSERADWVAYWQKVDELLRKVNAR